MADVLPQGQMQAGQLPFGSAVSYQFESDVASLFPGPDYSQPSSLERDTSLKSHFRQGVPCSNGPRSPGRYLFAPGIGSVGPSTSNTNPIQALPNPTVTSAFEHPNGLSHPCSYIPFGGEPVYSEQSSFTVANATRLKTEDPDLVPSPQTCFDGEPPAYNSNIRFTPDGGTPSTLYPSSSFDQWSDSTEQHLSAKNAAARRDSARSDDSSVPYTIGRRRTSECIEPGSVRAVYLEKNRKAANKCRAKQKKQQEDLVEAARDMERKNRVLKSEVEFLKSDLRELMEIVATHNRCPDTRLTSYVQLEADRLAARGNQTPIVELLSPKGCSSGSTPSGNLSQ